MYVYYNIYIYILCIMCMYIYYIYGNPFLSLVSFQEEPGNMVYQSDARSALRNRPRYQSLQKGENNIFSFEIFEIPSSRTSSYLRILCFRNLQMSSFLSGDWPVKTTTKLQHVYLTYHGSRSHHMQCSKLFRLVSIYII